MPKITYADEVDAHFGIPWINDLKYEKGELACALSGEEIDALPQERAETLSRLILDQPESEKEDPIQWGWTLPGWRRVMDNWKDTKINVVLGGNRSSKTTFASRLLVHMAQTIPEAEIRSLHVSEERSIADAQRYIWEALPMRYKRAKKKSENHSLQYTQKNGFNSAKAILPPTTPGAERGSTISFNNYRQYQADPQIFEGWSAHCIHMDEEAPEQIFETLVGGRTVDYHGRVLLTFTTLQGWTPLINSLLKGAETVETKYSDLMGRELPIEQISTNWPNCRIYYFWSEMSPFVDYNELIRTYSKQPQEVKLARLYGIPSKAMEGDSPSSTATPMSYPMNESPSSLTLRCVPPATSYAILVEVTVGGDMAGVMQDGSIYVYREFPDSTMGQWALPHVNAVGKSVGKPGPAQRPLGFGYIDYRDHFEALEEGEDIFERIVDPRMGAATVREKEGESNIINTMANLDFVMRPAPGVEVEAGIAKINDALAWDDTEPMTDKNRPKLFVSDRCENLISSMLEYTGSSRQEHFKDFVDCIRYLMISGADHISHNSLMCTGGGGY